MADPIRSTDSNRNASYPEDLVSRDPELDGPPPATPHSEQKESLACEDGKPDPSRKSVDLLMGRYAPPGPRVEYLPSAATTASPARAPTTPAPLNNAERAANTPFQLGYANRTSTPDLPLQATAALAFGRIPGTNVVVEVGSMSFQGGRQVEGQFTLFRASVVDDKGSAATVEAGTAQLSLGTHGKDGSIGLNVSGGASAFGFELTANESGNSLTGGASAGPNFEASSGFRDSDGDGKKELCARTALAVVTLGGCAETP